jgi:hypothetical protein
VPRRLQTLFMCPACHQLLIDVDNAASILQIPRLSPPVRVALSCERILMTSVLWGLRRRTVAIRARRRRMFGLLRKQRQRRPCRMPMLWTLRCKQRGTR